MWLAPPVIVGAMVLSSLAEQGPDANTELRQLIRRVAQRVQAAVVRESAVYGQLHAGIANAHYRRVHELNARLSTRFQHAGLPFEANWPAALTEPDVVRLRAEWQPVIAALRRGAHSREVSRQRDWSRDGWRRRIVWCECHCLLLEQRHEAAVRLWLDAAVVVLDGDHIASDPFDFVWNAGELSELVRGWRSRRLALLPEPARTALAAGLAVIDRRLARPVDLERLVATAARNVTSDRYYEWASADWRSRLSAWRTGFSPQQASIEAVALAARGLAELVPAAEPWPDREGQLQVFRRDYVRRHHDAMDLGEEFLRLELRRRVTLAEVRLLRMALQLHAGEQPDLLPDPLGSEALVLASLEGTDVLRSTGYVDHRGAVVAVERVVDR